MRKALADEHHVQVGRWSFWPVKFDISGQPDGRFWQLHRLLDGQGFAGAYPSGKGFWEAESRESFLVFALNWVQENIEEVAPELR